MKKRDYDLVVIGSGPGGYVAAIRAAQNGMKVACIEKSQSLGGTCLNVGCIPSKALLQSSEHYFWFKHNSGKHGISCKDLSFDFSTMMQRKDQVVKGLTQGVAALFKRHSIESILGTARVMSSQKIEVELKDGKREIECENIILATGSESIALPFLPYDEKQIVSSTGALCLSSVPKRLLVIGGGVIGVELASVYNRLGSEVTIVEMLDQICIAMDQTLSKNLLQLLKKQGIGFFLGTKVTGGKKENEHYSIQVANGDKQTTINADVVLVAVGRRPYIQGLGLQELGVVLNRGFVTVDNRFMTSIPHLYAIGDLIEGPMLAHRASEEGCVLADLLAGKQAHVNYMAIPNIIYTHPEVAAVGLTEKEARNMGLEIVIGTAAFRGNPRTRSNGDEDGLVKVIGTGPEKKLIGMHILGAQASELIQIGMVAIEKKMSLFELSESPFGHPTLSEAIKEACGQALGRAIHT